MADVGDLHVGFQDPTDIDKIRCSVLNALVTSSLCSTSDKSSWAFQLFKIYQQYPDNLLRDVMEKLKKDKMVSIEIEEERLKIY